MLKRKIFTVLLSAGFIVAILNSCKKGEHIEEIVATPEGARFNAPTLNGSYFINSTAAGMTYKIPVSISTVSNVDRTLQITYTSPTGAAQGTQYNGSNSITIKAGKVLDTLSINGLMSGYATAGRRDTLFVRIASPDTIFQKGTFRVVMQKYCDVTLAGIGGNYTRTYEGTYGPYTSAVTNLTSTGATTATATITNIYDSNISATATFNWTNPVAFSVTIAAQQTQYTSGGLPLFVRSNPSVPSTFSSCDNTITLNLQLYTSAGIVDSWTSSMAR